jgi:hypothetical protein
MFSKFSLGAATPNGVENFCVIHMAATIGPSHVDCPLPPRLRFAHLRT